MKQESGDFKNEGSNTHEQPTFDLAKLQIGLWKLAKRRTMDVANAMPENLYGFKAEDDGKSFGQQIAHMANCLLSVHARLISGERYVGYEKNADSLSKEALMADLELAFDTVIGAMAKLTDSELQSIGHEPGDLLLSKWQALLFMRDRITRLRVNAILSLRLNNIDPSKKVPLKYNKEPNNEH